jgi:hypothetical protein
MPVKTEAVSATPQRAHAHGLDLEDHQPEVLRRQGEAPEHLGREHPDAAVPHGRPPQVGVHR